MRPKFHHPLTETLAKVVTTFMLSNEIEFSPERLDPELSALPFLLFLLLLFSCLWGAPGLLTAVDSLLRQSGSKMFEAMGTTINTVVRRGGNGQPPNYVQTVLHLLFSAPRETTADFYDLALLKELGLHSPNHTTPFFGKVAPKGSLAWLIALHVSNEIHDPEMKNLASLWNEIVKEIRIHYENGSVCELLLAACPALPHPFSFLFFLSAFHWSELKMGCPISSTICSTRNCR